MRLPYLFVALGLVVGVAAGMFLETEPRMLGWLFAIGAGLSGGAFLAAIASGVPLAGGPPPGRTRRGAPARPAWFDEPDNDQPPPPDASSAPRNGTH